MKLPAWRSLLPIAFLSGGLRADPMTTAPAPATDTQIQYLSGTGPEDAVSWEFYCTGGRQSGVWTRIPVPSCWEQHGFGTYAATGGRALDALQARNDRLRTEVARLKTPEGVEDYARVQLGMVKQGEVFFQVVGEGAAPAMNSGHAVRRCPGG